MAKPALIFLLFVSFVIRAQPKDSVTVQQPFGCILMEEQAAFPGGYAGMQKFLSANMVYPALAIENGISGKVYVKYAISETGVISNIEVIRGLPGCAPCDAEAVRLITLMPAWTPAKRMGVAVKCTYMLPVSFTIR